jgi:hypothetical protein
MEWVRAEALGETELAFDDLVNQLHAGQDLTVEVRRRDHRAVRKTDTVFSPLLERLDL